MSQKGAIIYIDDDKTNRTLFGSIFGNGKLDGRTVIIFEEAEPAIQKLTDGDEIGLVVTDWNLAYGTSADLCKLALDKGVPLLIFSGSNPEEIRDEVGKNDITILDKSDGPVALMSAVKEKLG